MSVVSCLRSFPFTLLSSHSASSEYFISFRLQRCSVCLSQEDDAAPCEERPPVEGEDSDGTADSERRRQRLREALREGQRQRRALEGRLQERTQELETLQAGLREAAQEREALVASLEEMDLQNQAANGEQSAENLPDSGE